jgi:hypothetical protein
MIPQQRGRALRDDSVVYETGLDDSLPVPTEDWEALDALLQDVPLP